MDLDNQEKGSTRDELTALLKKIYQEVRLWKRFGVCREACLLLGASGRAGSS